MLENIIKKNKEIDKLIESVKQNKIETLDEIKKIIKQNLGQFYTTNQKYILQNLYIPDNISTIIEPFTGNADLLNFIDKTKYTIECYDIEPKKSYIIKKDTIQNPPSYTNKFIITNPPYLARNKSKNKTLFDKYDVNDLYKCFIKEIITNYALGGIIIIPLNFWSSIRKNDIDLRKLFLDKYNIIHLNIFEEKVFDDTSYTVCSFQFKLKTNLDSNLINITVYPSKTNIQIELNDDNNYLIGGHIYNLKTKNNYKINRATSKNIKIKSSNILVKCIDDNENNKIGLSIVSDDNKYIDKTPNLSSRTYATLVIEPFIDLEKQNELVNKFNKYLDENRKKYNSLFLTNYRESKDIARKRISFDLVYKMVEYILDNFNSI